MAKRSYKPPQSIISADEAKVIDDLLQTAESRDLGVIIRPYMGNKEFIQLCQLHELGQKLIFSEVESGTKIWIRKRS